MCIKGGKWIIGKEGREFMFKISSLTMQQDKQFLKIFNYTARNFNYLQKFKQCMEISFFFFR